MKTLAEFNTLLEAQQYEHKTYRKIGGNEASQILSINGSLDAIENAQNDTTAVEVIPTVPTTVGALCRTVVRTIQSGQFATDPSKEDGQLNRAATQALVANGVISQAQMDSFYAKAELVSTPYASKTEYDLQLAKDSVVKKPMSATVGNTNAIVSLVDDVEPYKAKVYNGNGKVVGYIDFTVAGVYGVNIPEKLRTPPFTVDDVYGAI